jgi:hypothetical protein
VWNYDNHNNYLKKHGHYKQLYKLFAALASGQKSHDTVFEAFLYNFENANYFVLEGARAHVQTGSWVHPASYTMNTGGWGALSPGIKRPEREADHLYQSVAHVKNAWRFTSIHIFSQHGV